MPSTQYEIDVRRAKDGPEPLSLEELRRSVQETISRRFAEAMPAVAEKLVQLALSAENEAVQLKASSRLLDEFSDNSRRLQHAPSTTVQILNNIPMPEVKVVNGKEADMVQIAGQPIALPPAPVVKVIR